MGIQSHQEVLAIFAHSTAMQNGEGCAMKSRKSLKRQYNLKEKYKKLNVIKKRFAAFHFYTQAASLLKA